MCRYQTTEWFGAVGVEWSCPFQPEPGEEFCIFHLPVEKKKPEVFWRHLASYIMALLDIAGTEKTKIWEENTRLYQLAKEEKHWIFKEHDDSLVEKYKEIVKVEIELGKSIRRNEKWLFIGFVFPEMDDIRNFNNFVFPAVNFQDTAFMGFAGFGNAKFSEVAYFRRVRFTRDANFYWARFCGDADFEEAKFRGGLNFEGGEFHKDITFRNAEFYGEVWFRGARIDSLLAMNYARLYNQVLFDGTIIGENAKILLWGLNFAYGRSEVEMKEGHTKGVIIQPAGQIVFRDITKGSNQISFLHTDIFTDRLCVRFSNVKWKTDPKEFIFDAKFAFNKPEKWENETGLPKRLIDEIPKLYFVREEEKQKTEGEVGVIIDKEEIIIIQDEKVKLARLHKCESLVKQDVERIMREIRRSTEEYGSYPDAGDVHIAEMDYRREKIKAEIAARKDNWFKKYFSENGVYIALSWLYKRVSNYGESPAHALLWVLGLWIVPFFVDLCWHRFSLGWDLLGSWLLNMITLTAHDSTRVVPSLLNFTTIRVLHKIFGISVITLFLLAIRRRFRR